jgi:predicted TIM-barrel fold metal-dependent hydrolase
MPEPKRPPGVPFPPDPNPKAPKFRVPSGSWDTHFHLYGPPDRFPYAETRLFTPPAAPFEHWQRISTAIGIARGVTVSPAVHGTNNDATLDAIERSEGRVRGMIRANAALTTQDIAALHRRGVRSMRFTFATHGGRSFDAQELQKNVANIESHGWVAAFLLDGDMVERHADVIGNLPVPVVLDGYSGISAARGVDQPGVRALFDLLARPNFYMKLMCADRDLNAGARYDDIVALSQAIVTNAPGRICWGSDWPHSYLYEANKVPNDGDLLSMLADFAPDERVRNRILVDNPARLFDFD